MSSRGGTTKREYSYGSSAKPEASPAAGTGNGHPQRWVVVTIGVLLAVLVVFSIIQTTTYNERESELLGENTALAAEKRELEGRLETLRLEGEARETELTEVAAVVAMMVTKEKNKLIEEKKELEEQLGTLRQANQAHEHELTDVTETMNEQKAKLVGEKARIETREQELTDVAAAVAVTLTREKANLKNRVQELEEQQSKLNAQVDDLVEERQELARLVEELSAVKGQLETLSAGIGKLEARSKKLDSVSVESGSGQ